MARNKELAVLIPLWAGLADGHFTVPEALLAARAAHGILSAAANLAAEAAQAVRPEVVEDDAVAAVLEAARAGQAFLSDDSQPWAVAIAKAKEDRTAREAEARVLVQAASVAEDGILGSAHELSQELITTHLGAALDEVISLVEKVQPRAAGLPWEQPERVIGMPQVQRGAWDAMTKAATRYQAIRGAQSALWRAAGVTDATTYRLLEMRNMHLVWPQAGSWQEGTPPWPTDPRGRLLWLVEHKDVAGLWMATPNEAQSALPEIRDERGLSIKPRQASLGVFLAPP